MTMPNFKIKCCYSEIRDINSIIPDNDNPYHHSNEFIDALAKIISSQGQRLPLIISERTGKLVCGHARLEAMKRLGWTHCAVDVQKFRNRKDELKHMLADNELVKKSVLDFMKVTNLLNNEFDTKDDFFFAGLWDEKFFSSFSEKISDSFDHPVNESEEIVSQRFATQFERESNIASQFYEIGKTYDDTETLLKSPQKLFDRSKTDEFLKLIESESKNLSAIERQVLEAAAYRFIKLNFANIAKLYCYPGTSVTFRKLAERLALVILDEAGAYKNGFFFLKKKIDDLVRNVNEK